MVNSPKGIKAFYTRVNDDRRTVAAVGVFAPRIGEIIGGSRQAPARDDPGHYEPDIRGARQL